MIDLLLTEGTVVTMDQKRRIIEDGAVAVDQGKILFVGSSKEAEVKFPEVRKTINCRNHAVMPGFVDVHGHGGHALIRGAIFDTSNWMAAVTQLYNHYVTDDYWYYEGRVSALDHLRAGITTSVCIIGAQQRCDDPVFSINHAKGYSETGLREVVCTGPSQPPWPHKFSRIIDGKRVLMEVSYEQVIESMETVIRELNHSCNDRIRAFVSPFGLLPSTNSSFPTESDVMWAGPTEFDLHQLKEMWRIADKYDTRIHAEAYGGSIYQMHKAGKLALLGPRVHLQHTSGCSFDELQILADTGTHVGVTFQSSTMLIPMLWMGVKTAIGTDGPKLLGNADLFQSMRMTQNKHKDELTFSTNFMFNLPSDRLLEMTTIDAAEVIGWEDDIGSLEIGKKADIITVNLMNPRMTPRFNIIDTMVMLGNGNDVDNVFVDGVHLLENGKVLSVDEEKVLMEGDKVARESLERIGYQNFIDGKEHFWGKVRRYDSRPKFDLEWQRKDGGYY